MLSEHEDTPNGRSSVPSGGGRCREEGGSGRGGDPVSDLGGTQRGARRTGRDLTRDRLVYSPRLVGAPEVLEQHRRGENGGRRVGDALAGDVRRGTVDRLER